uniref:CEBP_ZZ domain-containing protein n=1 Tax=Angiostrongylus cantonensis TaxID=6313 RepID=A0A0K0D7K5_ANGCA
MLEYSGAGRVAFTNYNSYIKAVKDRYVQLTHGEIDKKVEIKPYVLDDQLCDECIDEKNGGKHAPFFCPHLECLQISKSFFVHLMQYQIGGNIQRLSKDETEMAEGLYNIAVFWMFSE